MGRNRFGETLRNARRPLYNCSELAALLGVSGTYLSMVERGLRKPPAAAMIVRICQMLRRSDETDVWIEMAGRMTPELAELQNAKRLLQEAGKALTAREHDLRVRIEKFLVTGEMA